MEEDAEEEMDIVEASGESDEDIIREVIGEATEAMREQSGRGTISEEEEDNSYDDARGSSEDKSWAGNGSGF